jgi:nitrogen fixation/metabolism regulation signal transduction histidine kinase
VRDLSRERRALLLSLLATLPAVATALLLLASSPFTSGVRWLAGSILVASWVSGAFLVERQLVRSMQSISNVLGALRDGDFSVRAHRRGDSGALDTVFAEINAFAQTLSRQRAGAGEVSALLAKVIAEVDVAVFAFDRELQLKLVNHAGERLYEPSAAPRLGAHASKLGLLPLLQGPTPRTVELPFPGGPGQWELRRSTFRLEGLPHELLVLSDLRRALREEERQAWQRIIRVIGHEINNSLAPIHSIASDLRLALNLPSAERPADFEQDLVRGLAIIDRRSASLERFMTSYARLAKLPAPRLAAVDVNTWLHRVVDLERRMVVRLSAGPPLVIQGDEDQLDQLLINVIRNAVDAASETGGEVEVSWRKIARTLEVLVKDDGPGVADTRNLFVPFFTTKPDGSGIGLVLSRQICEAHRGTLTLESRTDRSGAIARLLLPLS